MGNKLLRFRCGWLSAILLVISITRVDAMPLRQEDILVSIGNVLAGEFVQLNTLFEYTKDGALVQSIPVPYPTGPYPGTEVARDIVVDQKRSIHVYNGTFDPFLSTYDPLTNTWTHATHSGWSTINGVTFGGIAAQGSVVFVTDMSTFGDGGADQASGIVRFNLAGGSSQRFADGNDFADLSIGLNGFLYALRAGSLSIDVYDPDSLGLLRTIVLPPAFYTGIAVNELGEIFAVGQEGSVYHFDQNGGLLKSAPTGFDHLTDIDLGSGGRLVIGQWAGRVIVGSEDLTNFTSFVAIDDPRGSLWTTFVAFADPFAVPEASSLVLLSLGLIVIATYRWARLERLSSHTRR